MLSADIIRAAIPDVLTEAHFPDFPNYYRGKVRENYDLPGGRRILISTDRQSAFDQVLSAVPFKGQVLTQTARFWFEATADICANHVLAYPDPNVVIGRHLKMLPIEMVVRDYLTGSTDTSIWPIVPGWPAPGLRRHLPRRFDEKRQTSPDHSHAHHQGRGRRP